MENLVQQLHYNNTHKNSAVSLGGYTPTLAF